MSNVPAPPNPAGEAPPPASELDTSVAAGSELNLELAAEAITLRIRWFGVAIGLVLVNVTGDGTNQLVLNLILMIGAAYAVIDTAFSLRGRVFLNEYPLIISAMESVFIGLLCHFEHGLLSPFRFYYFLSLLVCALRYPAWMTYTTLGMHAVSYTMLALTRPSFLEDESAALVLHLVLLVWVTWAGTSLSNLLRVAHRRLSSLNAQLHQNQALLERRIAERTRQLQESQALLVQQEKQAAFGLLAAGIAHEVGNPLAAISSLIQLLNRRDLDPSLREKHHLMDDQLRRIQRTLRELIDFSRPASNEEAACDVHEAVDAALNIAKYYKRKKGKTIHTRYARPIPLIRSVRDQLVQVVLNLILNALDATPEGAEITISTSLRGGWLRIDIADQGSGIDPANRARIFQPYFTTKTTGTGLGLFVCRNIVEHKLHGRIELTDSSSAGTTFTIFLTSDSLRDHPDTFPAEAAPDTAPQEASAS